MEILNGIVKDITLEENILKIKIECEEKELLIEEEINENNKNIYKEDEVIMIKQIIDGQEYYDIEVVNGDMNE